VQDFNIPIPEGDMLEIIFSHQEKLMNKYHAIEQINMRRKLPDPNEINLDLAEDQLRMKEFAWRITEELAESTECLTPGGMNEIHFLEELIDALHFSVEFDIMSHIGPMDITEQEPCPDKLEYLYQTQVRASSSSIYSELQLDWLTAHQEFFRMRTWVAIEALGKAMNTLKNKPWKSTHMITDRAAYQSCVIEFNHHLFKLMWWAGLNPTTLTQLYLNKNAVNQFRIRTNY
jgi:hypothetical protein